MNLGGVVDGLQVAPQLWFAGELVQLQVGPRAGLEARRPITAWREAERYVVAQHPLAQVAQATITVPPIAVQVKLVYLGQRVHGGARQRAAKIKSEGFVRIIA